MRSTYKIRCNTSEILILLFYLVMGFPFTGFSQHTFEEWKKEQLREFQEFRNERDKEFYELLKSNWVEINAFKPRPQYDGAKPTLQPKLDKPADLIPSDERPEIPAPINELSLESARETVSIRQEHEEHLPPNEWASRPGFLNTPIDFFELSLELHYPESLKFTLPARNEEHISNVWRQLGSSDYQPVVKQFGAIRERIGLNDWGYILLLHQAGQHIYGAGSDESILFTWFMMTREGFITKVGYDQNGVYLLIASEAQFFGTRYFTINNQKYYALDLNNGQVVPSSIFTYEGNHPDTGTILDLNLQATPRLQKSLMKRSLHFTYGDTTYNIPVHINRNVIAFYELYPLTEFNIYFRASTAPETQADLYTPLARAVEGKTETEAVNMILRFVQTAFQYKTDREQFGREKYFFPEETLYYPYSDCEDRAVLFTRLVKDILGLEVIGIKYPRHLATAVKFTNPPKGDYVMHHGETYTVSDPTYYNANIGMTMPQMRKYKPEIVTF